MVSKERYVPSYLGLSGDALYYLFSSAGYNIQPGPYADPQTALAAYVWGWERRNKSVSYSDLYGYEHIEGEVNQRDSFNNCNHFKSKAVNKPYLACVSHLRYPTYHYLLYYWRLGNTLAPASSVNITHLEEASPFVRARAWHNMQPRFEGSVDLMNSILELKDYKDCVKFLFKGDRLSRLSNLISNSKKFTPSKLPKDPTGIAAGAYLGMSLAIIPTYRDCLDILNQANVIVREKQDEFDKAGETRQKSHYSEILAVQQSGSALGTYNCWVSNGYYRQTKFTATLGYKYDYSMRDTVSAWIKYWGLTGTVEAFWNYIPGSFVIDYFAKIGDSLRAMTHDANVKTLVMYYGESLKTTHSNGLYTNGSPNAKVTVIDGIHRKDSTTPAGITIAGNESTLYKRWRTDPYYGPALPRLTVPKTSQQINMLALLRCLL